MIIMIAAAQSASAGLMAFYNSVLSIYVFSNSRVGSPAW